MAYCLPKNLSAKFQAALRSGDLHPNKLRAMTSEERREAFGKFLGEDHAREVNLKFEKQLLLKDQQKAMVNFVNDMQGLNETQKRDMVDQIMSMDRIISPKNARGFLEDLAAKKLGATVTHDEATEVFNLAQKAEQTKNEYLADPQNNDKRIAFGVDLVKLNDRVNELKGGDMTAWDHFINVMNLPKQLSTTADFSATLVQLSSMITSGRFWEGFVEQFKYFANEDAYTRLRADIITHPYYELAGDLGLSEIANQLKPGEELIQSHLIETANQYIKDASGGKIPNAVRAANRAFVGYINYVRFKTFTDLIDAAKLAGEDVHVGSPFVRDISENINTFTGRGNIGVHDKYGNAVPFLNLFAWTIRKVSGTLTLMSPVPFLKSSPTARAFAMRQLGGLLAATAAVYGGAAAVGAEVPTDPSDAHFGWIRVGKTWFNPLGDKPTYARLLWRLATGRIVNAQGKESHIGEGFPATTRADLVERFARGKLGPNASIVADALYGRDFMGNEMHWDGETLKREAVDRLIPMGISSYIDVVQNDPRNTVGQMIALTSIFGTNVYADQPIYRKGLSAWGDPAGTVQKENEPDLDRKLLEINEIMKFPPQTVNGIKLTDNQYKNYITLQGQVAKQQLEEAVKSGVWDNSSKEEKEQGWKTILKIARRQAQYTVLMNAQDNGDGENNPIFDQMEQKHLNEAQRKYGGFER